MVRSAQEAVSDTHPEPCFWSAPCPPVSSGSAEQQVEEILRIRRLQVQSGQPHFQARIGQSPCEPY